MPKSDRVPAADLPPGAVRPAGHWAVANDRGRLAAVSRRC
ncbi:Rieske (2Fe-2S) protein, partial [Modestobacter versicolor]